MVVIHPSVRFLARKATLMLALLAVPAAGFAQSQATKTFPANEPAIVPWPTNMKVNPGSLTIQPTARIVAVDPTLAPLTGILAEDIFRATGVRLAAGDGKPEAQDIALSLDPKLKHEEYKLNVSPTGVMIVGQDYNGVAMGTVTLLQALKNKDGALSVQRLVIDDAPPLLFRGAMLDVARKPHSIATLKACVDAARMYKVRYIQLHMTDENAWTFPSTKYPQLGSQNFAWAGGEKPTVYDIDELKGLVAYADARGVTIFPELETPGHSGQMRAAMPEVFNFKDEKGELVGGGVINIANPRAYEVIDTLVEEAAEIFKSSPFINMGCDEATFQGTEHFPEMQALMKRENLADAGAIYSYHVNQLAKITKKHGKRMIVWEGAPLGPIPLPKDVILLPWVGGSGWAAEVVRSGYDVINPPWGVKEAYMDPYEVNGAQLKHGEPHLIGAMAIQWQAPEEVALPFFRYNASLRNEPTHNPEAHRGVDDFIHREAQTDVVLDHVIHGFTLEATGLLDPQIFGRLDPTFTKSVTLTLQTYLKGGTVRYTLDGKAPTAKSPVLDKPLELKENTTVRAAYFPSAGANGAGQAFYPYMRTFSHVTQLAHDAVGAKVSYTPELPGYPGPGPKALTDGLLAAGDSFLDQGYIGWNGAPVQITIDLGKTKLIKSISPRSIKGEAGLDIPPSMEMQLSNNGKTFETVGTVDRATAAVHNGWYSLHLKKPAQARYIRVNVTVQPGIWMFMDEIDVNGDLPGPELVSEATGKKVTFATPPDKDYSTPGLDALTDGYITPTATFGQLQWLGWQGRNIEATIDLGKPTELHEVGGRFLQHVWSGVFPPHVVTVLTSNDGKTFTEIGKVETPQDNAAGKIETIAVQVAKPVKARYVKVIANTNGQWLFCDELFVNRKK